MRTRDEFERAWVWLEPSMKLGIPTHSKEDLWAEIESNRAFLWLAPDAAAVTRVCRHPNCSVFDLWLVGGAKKSILGFLPHMRRWAKELHCDYATISGREGWWRFLNKDKRGRFPVFFEELN